MLRARINQTTLELLQGDITQQDADAIVNAANTSLLSGGGVDGAIHRVAGAELLAATRKLGGCETGDAKITKGYKLKARYVIHTIGPIYRSNDADVPRLLTSAYRRSLEVALERGVQSLAFPAISTGVYGYPLEPATLIALSTVCDFAAAHEQPKQVRFVLFDARAMNEYQRTLSVLMQRRGDLQSLD
ncbi:MAG: O-acetyl-ADP-ribose deacetylase [Chloroflexota bacterium]